MKFNPFRPSGLVSPGMFAGRIEELVELDKSLFQTSRGNPRHFLIHGERGIGKSSLMLVVDYLARGEVKGIDSGNQYNFITAKTELEPALELPGLVAKIGLAIATAVREMEPMKTLAQGAWDFIKRWEVVGVKYNMPDTQVPTLAESLCDSLLQVYRRYCDTVDGIFIMIDEADKGGPSTHLGQFLKVMTEKLEKRGLEKVLFGLSGISTAIDAISRSHESAPRILNHLHLQPLVDEERKEVIRKGLDETRAEGHDISIRPDAEDWIAKFSEGFPHFIQQYASSAFDTDNDDCITIDDVMHGAFKENGALDQLGRRYFQTMYRERINSDEYREVLKVMAASPDKYVSRQHIADQTGLKKTTLGNALQALKGRSIILPHPQKQGFYKLPSDSFALWIRMQAERDQLHDSKAF